MSEIHKKQPNNNIDNKEEKTYIQMTTLTISDFNRNDEFAEIKIHGIPKIRARSVNLKIRSISLEGDENLLPNKDKFTDADLDDIMTLSIHKHNTASTYNSSLTYKKMKSCTTPDNLAVVISQALNDACEIYNQFHSTSHSLKCVYLENMNIMEYEFLYDENDTNEISVDLTTVDYQPAMYVLGLSYTDGLPYRLDKDVKLNTSVIHMIPGPKILVRCKELEGYGIVYENEFKYKWTDIAAEFDHPEDITTRRVNFSADPLASSFIIPPSALDNNSLSFTVVCSNRPRVVYPLERVIITYALTIESEYITPYIYNENDYQKHTPPQVLEASNYLTQYNAFLKSVDR